MAEAGLEPARRCPGLVLWLCFLSVPLPKAHARLGTSTACFLARILLLTSLVLLHGSRAQASLLIFGPFSTRI